MLHQEISARFQTPEALLKAVDEAQRATSERVEAETARATAPATPAASALDAVKDDVLDVVYQNRTLPARLWRSFVRGINLRRVVMPLWALQHKIHPAICILRESFEPDLVGRQYTFPVFAVVGGMLTVLYMLSTMHIPHFSDHAYIIFSVVAALWVLLPIVGLLCPNQLTWRRYFFDLEQVWPDREERQRFKKVARQFGRGLSLEYERSQARPELNALKAQTPAQQVHISALRLLDAGNARDPSWNEALENILAQRPAPWRERLLREAVLRTYKLDEQRAQAILRVLALTRQFDE